MKRKTFGRVAAAGMAAVSAVSAMSIVASADLTKSGQMSKETNNELVYGTSYKVSWDYQTYIFNFKIDEVTGDVTTTQVGQEMGQDTGNGITSGLSTSGAEYYWTSTLADGKIKTIKDNVKAKNDKYNEALAKAQMHGFYLVNSKKYKENTDKEEKVFASKPLANGKTVYCVGKKDDTNIYWSYDSKGENTATGISSEPTTERLEKLEGSDPTKSILNESQLAAALGSVNIYLSTDGSISSTGYTTKYTIDTTKNSTASSGKDDDDTGSSGGTTTTDPTDYVKILSQYSIPSSYRYATGYAYSMDGSTWYPNMDSLRADYTPYVSTAVTSRVLSGSDAWSSTNCYFDAQAGAYRSVGGTYRYYVDNYGYYNTYGSDYAVYRVGSLYYYSWSDAYSAANGNTSLIVYDHSYSSRGNYFSRTTGRFYSTYSDALNASGGVSSRVISFNGYYDGYYDGYGYYYDYSDPYFYYFMNSQASNNSSSSNDLGGSSVKLGNGSGWNYVRNYVASAKSGATLNVSLNGESTIPSAVMTALDGKNVTVNFTLSNGSVISFNGKDISNPKEVDVNVVYNAKEVPSKLVAKAKSVNDGVSTAQLTISGNTFGGEAGLNVKFNASREGYTAKIYRYNSAKNSLQYIDKGTIGSNGRVSFDGLTQGGEYVIVVC